MTTTRGSLRLGMWLLVGVAGCGRPSGEPAGAEVPADGVVGGKQAAGLAWQALDAEAPLQRLVFGSCFDQRRPAPIVDAMIGLDPELVLLIGDNVYADAMSERGLSRAYEDFLVHPEMRRLGAAAPLRAIWDDHDYGINDAGAEYPLKAVSKRIMLDAFGVPSADPRRDREGNYDAFELGPSERRVQVILLDTRWFRSPLRSHRGFGAPYAANDDPDATLLGEAQWAWLDAQLERPAALRLLVSSIVVVPDEHGWESWAKFPRERARLLERLGRAGHVVILSGDRHRGEVSRLDAPEVGYPLFELTSSSLNKPLPAEEVNRFRRGELVQDANFGTVLVDWGVASPAVMLQLVDEHGVVRSEQRVELGTLARPP